jgi:hypothetical protein
MIRAPNIHTATRFQLVCQRQPLLHILPVGSPFVRVRVEQVLPGADFRHHNTFGGERIPSFRNGGRVAGFQSGWTIRRAVTDLPVRPSEFPHVGRMKKNGAPQTNACAGKHGAT